MQNEKQNKKSLVIDIDEKMYEGVETLRELGYDIGILVRRCIQEYIDYVKK